jgi:hypothetical protein
VVLSREEKRLRGNGVTGYLDARRKGPARTKRVELDRETLVTLLRELMADINELAKSEASLRRPSDAAYAMSMLTETSRALLTVV